MRKFLLTISLVLFVVPCSAQVRQGMRPADLLRVVTVTDAQISPNGQWVVYTVSSVEEDKSVSSLWLMPRLKRLEHALEHTASRCQTEIPQVFKNATDEACNSIPNF